MSQLRPSVRIPDEIHDEMDAERRRTGLSFKQLLVMAWIKFVPTIREHPPVPVDMEAVYKRAPRGTELTPDAGCAKSNRKVSSDA